MIALTHRTGQQLYVFGLGQTGLSVIAALSAGGARVLAWDDGEAGREQAAAHGAELGAPETLDWQSIDALVLSPGVPLTHPTPHQVVTLANSHQVAVIGDTELFIEEIAHTKAPARLVAITGTNGKSTTTALIGHLLSQAGVECQVGGNIGSHAVLELSPAVNPAVYVIEFSSYQIDLTPHLKPDVAVFLNLSHDHLDRHGGMEGYVAAKAKIFARQGDGDALVLGQDDARTASLAASVPEAVRVIPISQEAPQPGGAWADGMMLIDGTGPSPDRIADLAGIASLRGRHNIQNAAAAAAALRALGIPGAQFAPGFASFAGLAHRMQQVSHEGRTLFVNDSKATNAEATEKALVSFSNIHWIAGGRAKEGGIEALAPHFRSLEKAYLIGEAAEDFADTLVRHDVAHEMSGTLERAVEAAISGARASAGSEPVVLLSPAAASFDQFENFEARGDTFRQAVLRAIARDKSQPEDHR